MCVLVKSKEDQYCMYIGSDKFIMIIQFLHVNIKSSERKVYYSIRSFC